MTMIFRFIFLTAIRDKLYLGLMAMLLAAFGLSSLFGFTALAEGAQMQLVYFAGVSRAVVVCGMILFICFHINRSFEHKEIQFILAKPISRNRFIMAYWLSFNVVSAILLLPLMAIILFFSMPNAIGLMAWVGSLVLELMIVSTFAIVGSLILNSAVVSVLATVSFYLMSRLMGFFLHAVDISSNAKSLEGIANGVLKTIAVIFPRLDLFSSSEWLLYGVNSSSNIGLILLQSLIYIPMMLSIAFYDFGRKEF